MPGLADGVEVGEEGIVVNCTEPSGDKMLAGPSDDDDEGDEGEPTGPHIEELTTYRHIVH